MEDSALKQHSDLIDLIYATAMDNQLWPELLHLLEKQCFANSEHNKHDVFEVHLQRALEISHQHTDLRHENALLLSIINRLPIGVIIVRANADVTAMNNRAYELLQHNDLLRIENSRLIASSELHTHKLNQFIHAQATGKASKHSASYIIPADHGVSDISLWITPAAELFSSTDHPEPLVAIYLASRQLRLTLSADSLVAMYGLTPSEIKLVQALTNGSHHIRDAAKAVGISYETGRGYLKTIMHKTHTHSLAELLKLLLSSPAALVGEMQSPIPVTYFSVTTISKEQSGSITLHDGRKLAYCEYGDPSGTPVLYFHSLTGGRLECGHNQQALLQSSIRLVAVDRPGFGDSDIHEGRTLMDWVSDIRQFTDQLGIDQFSLLTFAAGGPYGLACCHIMPERVNHLCMVSPPGLQLDDQTLKQYGTLAVHRMIFRIAMHMPGLLSQTVRMVYKFFMRDIDQYWQRIYPDLCESDRQQIEQHRQLMKQAFLDGGRHGGIEYAREISLFIKPFGFDVSTIQTPVTIWHGQEDRHTPICVSQSMINQLPHGELITIDDEGFYMIYKQWPNIIVSLSSIVISSVK